MSLLEDLEQLRAAADAAFRAVPDAAALEAARVEFLGTRGKLKALLGRMGEVAKEDRPAIGKRANQISVVIQAAFEIAKQRVVGAAPAAGGPAVAGASGEGKSLEVLRQERQEKLARYEAKKGAGSAWGGRFPGALSIEEIRKKFPPLKEGEAPSQERTFGMVRLAARVMLRRDQSRKLIFLTVQDLTGQMQVALWNSKFNEEDLELLRDTLDLWDIVGVEGELAYTQRGEPTVWATKVQLLSKCLAPPPEKFHGLHDKELRYRQRYLDLITTPESRKTFVLRAKAVARLRRYLDERGFLEMETPVLQTIPGGAAARPFRTHLNSLGIDMYLRIATEIPLKKLLVGGFERVYEVGRIFRNEGVDARHNPEFTMVEIYQAYGDLRDMMALTEGVVSTLAQELTGSTTVTWRGRKLDLGLRELDEFSLQARKLEKGARGWPCRDYCTLLKEYAGVTPDDEAGLDEKLRAKKLDPTGLSRVEKIDGVFGAYVEEHLQDACFVINQPVEMSPLCRAHPQNSKFADRFEPFAAGMELGNAYSELNDASEQRKRLGAQPRALWLKTLTDLRDHVLLPDDVKDGVERVLMAAGTDANWEADRAPRQMLEYILSGADPELEERVLKYRVALERLTEPEGAIDHDFLSALEHAMPPAGGLGIGVDRVVMLLAGVDSIRDVILFPLMRPEGASGEKTAST